MPSPAVSISHQTKSNPAITNSPPQRVPSRRKIFFFNSIPLKQIRLMEFPIFPNCWNASSRPRNDQSFRGIPVVQVNPNATQSQPSKPKVVSIPVHFVGSEQRAEPYLAVKVDRSVSATRIQKVFRGFLVRKNMEKIGAIREEVNEIERRVSKAETVDLIRNDSKERLRVNEMLMSLLLKLDSVKGVDSGVRYCRKSVIKKAIALQELVDAIVSGEQSTDSNNAEAVDQDPSQGIITDFVNNCNQTLESQNHDEVTNQYNAESVPNLSESETVVVSNNEQVVANQEQGPEVDEESMETSWGESQTDSSANPEPENTVEQEEAEAAVSENETCCPPDNETEKEGNNMNSKEDPGENKRNEELLQRIMEDNEKMMGLMEMLYERNEMQTRILSALSQRVEQLEKAFMCDKLRRKKRRSAAAGSVDCDAKKCGKRS